MLFFLLVGDNTPEIEDLMIYIRYAGDKVFLVSDMQTAMHIIQSTSLHFDALIVSLAIRAHRKAIRVEKFAGLEIARITQLLRPGLPILIFSKSNPVYYADFDNPACNLGFIPKPPRFFEVARILYTLQCLKEGSPC
jgi:hypothetical protein